MLKKKYLFLNILLILIFVFLFKFPSLVNFKLDSENLLGNVAKIDINTLKQWQQNFGFQKKRDNNLSKNEIKILQKALSTDKELYPEGVVNGLLDKDTIEALVAFQKENSLPETGIFDEDTRGKMNEIFYVELCPTRIKEYPDFTDFIFSKENSLPEDFVPKDLKNLGNVDIKTVGVVLCLRPDALDALKNMFNDAKEENIILAVSSGFRTPAIQKWLVDYYGSEAKGIAQPGHSEHQLGTAVDLTGKSNNYKSTDDNFYKTKEYLWLQKNASKYGFFMSYPKGNTEYKFEPWHYRFLGVKK